MIITRHLTDTASASTASDIQLGSCVTEIGQGAFSGYTNITDVEFPDSLTTIGVGAFSGSSITSVDFPDSVTTIGNSAFTSCNLSELTIPSGVTSIGDRAFMYNNSLEKINVSASTVPTLGGDAFDYTNNCTIDDDGIITVKDATAIQKYLASTIGLDDYNLLCADFNKDGTVNITDATAIQKTIAGI